MSATRVTLWIGGVALVLAVLATIVLFMLDQWTWGFGMLFGGVFGVALIGTPLAIAFLPVGER